MALVPAAQSVSVNRAKRTIAIGGLTAVTICPKLTAYHRQCRSPGKFIAGSRLYDWRNRLRSLAVAWGLALFGVGLAHANPLTAAIVAPEAALHQLMEGTGITSPTADRCRSVRPGQPSALARSQHPYAVILRFSDSRVLPEIILKGAWESRSWSGWPAIFPIRMIIGSIEYAAEHLARP